MLHLIEPRTDELIPETPVDIVVDIVRRSNALYILSVLCMLTGCFLISIPSLQAPGRGDGVLALITTVQFYEVLLILLCAWHHRRSARRHESITLFMMEMLFLFDMTFAVNGVYHAFPTWGILTAIGVLLFGIGKLALLEKLTRGSMLRGLHLYLILLMTFVHLASPLLTLARQQSPEFYVFACGTLWSVLGLIPLALLRSRAAAVPAAGDESLPIIHRPGIRQIIALSALGLTVAQFAAQSWVQSAVFHPLFLFGLLGALLVILPKFGGWAWTVDNQGKLLVLYCATVFFYPRDIIDVEGFGVRLSSLRIALGLASLLLWGLGARDRRSLSHEVALCFSVLTIAGHDLRSIGHTLVEPGILPATFICFACLGYALLQRSKASPWAATFGFSVFAIATAHALDTLHYLYWVEFLRFAPLNMLLVLLYMKDRNPVPRYVLVMFISIIASIALFDTAGHSLPYSVSVIATLAIASIIDRKAWAIGAGAYTAAVVIAHDGLRITQTPTGWAIPIIVCAFLLLGSAFAVHVKPRIRFRAE